MNGSPKPMRRILLPIRVRLAVWYSLLLGVMLVGRNRQERLRTNIRQSRMHCAGVRTR